MDKKTYEISAPVAVFVYNRPEKTRTLFESLRQNYLALDSEVYVFSDAAKDSKAESSVNEVRQFIDSLASKDWFKNVIVHKAEKNKGLAGSVIDGVTDILDRYGKIIVLEDDLVLSRYFLVYMNECLNYFCDDKKIWSIDGYSHNPTKPKGYDSEIYLTYRASSWGWGTWKDRWDMVDWDMKDYKVFSFNPAANIKFMRGGNDLPSMLRAFMKGRIDSWAIRWCFYQSKNDMLSVAPLKSLVSNNGLDGSGTNCRDNKDRELDSGKIETDRKQWVNIEVTLNKELIRDFYRRHHLSVYVRIRDKLKELKKG